MSDEMKRKRLRYLQLKAKAAAAQAVAPAPEPPQVAAPAGPSRLDAFGRGVRQGATFGFADEIGGAVQGGLQGLANALPSGALEWAGIDNRYSQDVGDTYRAARNDERAQDARAENAHRGFYLGGNLAGGLLTAPLMPAGGAKTLGQLMLQGAKVGAGAGAAYGLGASDADLTRGEFAGAAGDTTLGALLGGGFGGAAPPVARGAGWVARNVGAPLGRIARGGYVTPTAEAQRLTAEGAELSLGQMDPASAFGRIEELTAGKVMGGSVGAARERGISSTRDVLLSRAGAPGAQPPTRGAPVEQQLQELRQGFAQLYDDALGGVAVRGADKTGQAFESAVNSVKDASPAVRRRALAWLTDQAQTLKPGPGGTVEARAVQALRTQLRDRIRGLGEEGADRQLREIYGKAVDSVSDILTSGLPPERSSMLTAADTSYRNLLTAEDAARRAFVQDREFTAAQLLQAMRKRGATPDLEATARDAQAVIAARYPPTGMQVAAVEGAPVLRIAGPAWAAMANASPGLRSHALNAMWQPGFPSRAAGTLGRGLERAGVSPRSNALASRSLADLLRPRPTTPFADDPEDPRY